MSFSLLSEVVIGLTQAKAKDVITMDSPINYIIYFSLWLSPFMKEKDVIDYIYRPWATRGGGQT